MTTSIAPAGSSGSSGSAGRTGPAVLPHQRTLITVLAMALGPIALMALLTWAFWHPTTRLAQLDAAVVNLDEPVTVNGEHMPLGRQLAAELVGGSSHLDSTYNWVITTAEDAAKGLREGTYVALVTIPEGFSAAATSSAGAPVDARRAMIEVATSTRAAQFDDVISRVVVDAAVRALSNQVTSGYLSGVYFGFTTLKDGLTSATDGAWRLADGTGQAVDGAVQLDSGAGQLVAGADQLARGSRTVANGVAELSSQVDRQLVAAAPQLRGGIVRLNDGLQQMKTAAPQLRQVADPLGEGADAVSKWAEGLEGDAGAQAEFLVSLVEACRETADDAFCDRVRDFLSNALGDPDVAQALNQFLDCLGQAADEVGAFADQMGDLADGLEQAAAGSAELERKTRDYVAGVNALGRGARDTAGGTAQVAVGAQQLADWLRELKSGTKQAADGSRELDAGANELASGLADARDQVPSYSDSEQSKLQAAVSQPIVAEQAGFEGAAALALYATLALWVGAVAIFMIVAPRPANAFGTRRPALATTLRAFGPAAVLAAVQGVLVGVAMAVASSSGPGRGVGLVAAAVGVSLAFTALMQGLTTLLGGSVSRLTAVMVGVVAIAPGVVSSIPEPLARLADWLPTQPAHWLFHSALGGPGGVGGSIAELAAWCALGLAVTMAATAQARSITPRQFWSSLPQRT